MAVTFRPDSHLYPLYVKFASDRYGSGDKTEGDWFFKLACNHPRDIEHRVYRKMYKIKPEFPGDSESGRKSFWSGTTTPLERSQAIDRALRKVDNVELGNRENQVHKHLWLRHRYSKDTSDMEYGRKAFNNANGKSSTIEDRSSAMASYAFESRILSWLTDNEYIHLIKREDGELECLAIDARNGRSWSTLINRNGRPAESAISFLSQCNVEVNGNSLSFSKPSTCQYWPENIDFIRENKGLKLIVRSDKQLVWRLFDRTMKTVSSSFAFDDTIEAMEHMEFVRRTEGKSCFSDLNINIASTAIGRIVLASVVFKTQMSLMDNCTPLDSKNWAVTLFDSGNSRGYSDYAGWAGHSIIAYEGIEDGMQFLRYAHVIADKRLVPFPQVQILDANEFGKIDPRTKTQTWPRKRQWVQLMVKKIKEQEGKPMPFDIMNESLIGYWKFLKSQFSMEPFGRPADNCLTWSIRNVYWCGIKLPICTSLPIPNEYVSMIANQPSLVNFDEICG